MRSISLGVKATGAWRRQPSHLRGLIIMKSGGLSFLEPSWLLQACTGISLRVLHTMKSHATHSVTWNDIFKPFHYSVYFRMSHFLLEEGVTLALRT
jgi:hypothetical protein